MAAGAGTGQHGEAGNPETVQKRIAVYDESTKPLIDYYRNSGLYEEINGLQDVDAVFADIIKALEK